MEQAHAAIPRIRRLAAVVGVVSVLAAVGAPTAAAELGLPELGPSEQAESGLDVQLREATATLAQATEAVEQTAVPPLGEATEALAQATAPALEPVRQAQLLTTVAEKLGEVTESVVTPVVETLPVAEAGTQPLRRQTRSSGDPVIDAASARGALAVATDPPRAASAPAEETVAEKQAISEAVSEPPVAHTPGSSDRDELTVFPRRAPGVPLPSAAASDFATLPSAPGPFAPGRPLSGLASAAASPGAGTLVPLLAALAAALLLAAPGLSRRLGLRLALWPQPILSLSLERPG